MTREECEKAVAEKMAEVISIVNEYSPNTRQMTMWISKDPGEDYWIDAYNTAHWKVGAPDDDTPISICGYVGNILGNE